MILNFKPKRRQTYLAKRMTYVQGGANRTGHFSNGHSSKTTDQSGRLTPLQKA